MRKIKITKYDKAWAILMAGIYTWIALLILTY